MTTHCWNVANNWRSMEYPRPTSYNDGVPHGLVQVFSSKGGISLWCRCWQGRVAVDRSNVLRHSESQRWRTCGEERKDVDLSRRGILYRYTIIGSGECSLNPKFLLSLENALWIQRFSYRWRILSEFKIPLIQSADHRSYGLTFKTWLLIWQHTSNYYEKHSKTVA